MAYVTDPRVDAYIDGLADWQQVICREVRALVHAADAEVVETIKRTLATGPSTRPPSRRCSGRSSPTTAPADGEG